MTSTGGRQWRFFFGYTAWSVVALLVLMPLVVLFARDAGAFGAEPYTTSVLFLQIAIGAWSGWRSLSDWSRSPEPVRHGRWDLPRLGRLPSDWTLIVAAGLAGAVVVSADDSRLAVASLSALAITAGMRIAWWIPTLLVLAAAAIIPALGVDPPHLGIAVSLTIAGAGTSRASIWLAAVVRELEDARQAQSQLAVAEERLRFARDLHDVTGRDLSVIAVKAELVSQLAERGDGRAAEHGREVAQIARASLAEIRALVRGYREADLATELQGTASLLRSTHAQVQIVGSAQDVPAEFADAAAWVLREGGTNILRHADPAQVVITLGVEGMSLVNDGVPETGEPREGSGLTGLRERLGPDCPLTVRHEDGTFTLDVRFDTSGEHR